MLWSCDDVPNGKGTDEGSAAGSVSRREFLRMAGLAGATIGLGAGMGGLLAACGEEATSTTSASGGESSTTAVSGSSTSVSTSAEIGDEIKVGYVQAITGSLASFAVPTEYIVGRWRAYLGDGLVCGDGKKHPVTVLVSDCQSDTNRAAQVTGDLINNDKVSVVMGSGSPDVVTPVAQQGEAYGCPSLSTICPWQSFMGDVTEYKWAYLLGFGIEDLVACSVSIFNRLATNKSIGCLFDNSADGVVFGALEPPYLKELGFKVDFPAPFQPGTEDYTSQISSFKKNGVEIVTGVTIPPDFTNFWKGVSQQGITTLKACVMGKALLFPQSLEAIGEIADGLITDIWWHPSYPWKESLFGWSCQELADDYEKVTGQQQTAPLLSYCLGEMAFYALRNATDPMSKDSIIAAIETMKMETIVGPVDFTAPIMSHPGGEGLGAFAVGPGRKTKNVYGHGECAGQWVIGSKWPFELKVVDNAAAPFYETSKLQPVMPLRVTMQAL